MKFSEFTKAVKDFAYGVFILNPLLNVVKMRYNIDKVMITILYGDVIGFPTMSPIYKLRLLPYYYTKLNKWKLDVIKEYDITDKMRK